VIEDSWNGLASAHAAGMKCLVTVSSYTKDEDFSAAELVVSCLGDPGGERCKVLANRSAATPGDYITAADLETILDE
jgi:beta-phosphoglucomutase-like phosphatase (HAD superfamily)